MKSRIIFFTLSFLLLAIIGLPQQQEYPYAQDIQKFKDADLLNHPPKDAILFAGSSSFTMWTDVQDYFPEFTIINRGFGGSTILDQLHYIDDIVFAYSPRQIVLYCGENDLAYSDTVTGEVVAERFKKWFFMVRSELPDVNITYVSMKPSPSRWHLKDRFIVGNFLIWEFLDSQENTGFVNVWDDMLTKDREPDPSIFLDDMLHMNHKGYAIWQKKILPELIKN